MELGGKSPLKSFYEESVADARWMISSTPGGGSYRGAVMFALNQGEVCTCPSKNSVFHEDIFYDKFMAPSDWANQKLLKWVTRCWEIHDGGLRHRWSIWRKILFLFWYRKQRKVAISALWVEKVASLTLGLRNRLFIKPTIFKAIIRACFSGGTSSDLSLVSTTFPKQQPEEGNARQRPDGYGLGAGLW